jgi:hypothetical protein
MVILKKAIAFLLMTKNFLEEITTFLADLKALLTALMILLLAADFYSGEGAYGYN